MGIIARYIIKPLQATSVNYKLIRKIKDDKFDAEELDQYTLLTQLGVRDLQVAVVDSADNRLLFFEDYIFNGLNSYDELMVVLRSLYDSHELLMAGFWKGVIFSIKNNHLVQVPDSLFVQAAADEYLRFNAQSDGEKEETLFCRHHLSDAVTVFAIPRELHGWIGSLYPNSAVRFIHQSASLIEGVLNYARSYEGTPLFVYVDRFKLHIVFVKNNTLVYYNQFVINQFADYLKYIMLVMKGLNLDQSTSQVMLWGYIGKNSPHYHEFYKYIHNVVFGERPAHLKFGYMFDEVQEHHFFDLYSMNLFKP
ncbi:MAG TPA: DUF3822 family protein [Cyclobacteriaceae bacterium]|jgi:hypothetical protein|nr:DUF3822 family protein [Cyclobacteriaceae bacterium]